LKNKKLKTDTTNKNTTKVQLLNQDSIPPKPVCYGAVGNRK
jgi:hypothetical protein